MSIGMMCTVILWAIALGSLLPAVRTRNWLLVYCASSIALAVTLQVDEIYYWLDGLLGEANIVNLVGRTVDIACLTGWHVAVQAAASGVRGTRRSICISASTGLALVCAQAALFLSRSWNSSDPHLDSFAGSYVLSAYAGILWIAMIWIAASAIVVGLRSLRRRMSQSSRVASVLVTVGAAFALAWSTILVTQEIKFAVTRDNSALFPPVNLLVLVAGICVISGLASVMFTTGTRRSAISFRAWIMWMRLRPLWARVTSGAPQVRINSGPLVSPQRLLHRRIVEIRDAALVLDLSLSPADEQRLSRSEGGRQLLSAGGLLGHPRHQTPPT